MALTTITVTEYDVTTKQTRTFEKEVNMPNPRISEIQQRLQDIRMELQVTDYKAIKYAEGQYADGEYDAVKAARAALRAEYNQLEAELATL
jgi:uncharacterized protein involved in exopolysaccharide biosynthesis